jgi:hypothetical protein
MLQATRILTTDESAGSTYNVFETAITGKR